MADHEIERASTTAGLPVSPSMGPALESADVPAPSGLVVDSRTVLLCLISVTVALAAALVAQFLIWLINLITNISFRGQFTAAHLGPTTDHLGPWVMVVPVVGG